MLGIVSYLPTFKFDPKAANPYCIDLFWSPSTYSQLLYFQDRYYDSWYRRVEGLAGLKYCPSVFLMLACRLSVSGCCAGLYPLSLDTSRVSLPSWLKLGVQLEPFLCPRSQAPPLWSLLLLPLLPIPESSPLTRPVPLRDTIIWSVTHALSMV